VASDVTVSVTSMANRGRSRGAGVMSRCRVHSSEWVTPVIETPETGSVPQVESRDRLGRFMAVPAARQWRPVRKSIATHRGGARCGWFERRRKRRRVSLCADAGSRASARERVRQAVGERGGRSGTTCPPRSAGVVSLRCAGVSQPQHPWIEQQQYMEPGV